MEMTITEYCAKNKKNKRYLQRIIQENKKELLHDSHGIKNVKRYGRTYVLTVRQDYKFAS